MNDVRSRMVAMRDGVRLAVHEMGSGRPVILMHGLFSTAEVNWVKFGHAARVADAGCHVIMPDLRAHGMSDKPHDPAAYPDDVLARDVEDLVAAYDLDDFDLGGFSLGARTTARAIVGGVRPRRAVLAGMGLEGLAGWTRRQAFFIGALDRFDTAKRGEPEWMAIQFMKTMDVDRDVARLLLGTFSDTDPAALAALSMPALVVCGADDDDNGSAPRLAETLSNARLVTVPGTHMSSVTEAALGEAIAAFLTDPSLD